jgi:hypothetical protein
MGSSWETANRLGVVLRDTSRNLDSDMNRASDACGMTERTRIPIEIGVRRCHDATGRFSILPAIHWSPGGGK